MLIESYQKDIEKMKQVTRAIVDSGDSALSDCPVNVDSSMITSADYFSSYAHFGIHHEMLNVSLVLN